MSRSAVGLVLCLAVLAGACVRRESQQVTRDRAAEAMLIAQIGDLRALVARAEAGQLTTRNRIAIGIAEETSEALLNASLPQEQVVGGHLLVRIERARPYFQGDNAVLVFQASARELRTGATARLELGGRLVNFRIEKDTLTTGVELVHFQVVDTSLGQVAAGVLELLVRQNRAALSRLLPGIVIPVHLEKTVEIAGLREGVVVVKAGALPLQMTLAQVIPVNHRLWILLDVKAGTWQRRAAAESGG